MKVSPQLRVIPLEHWARAACPVGGIKAKADDPVSRRDRRSEEAFILTIKNN